LSLSSSIIVSGNTLGEVWLNSMEAVCAEGVQAVRPLVALIENFDTEQEPVDSLSIRSTVDADLSKRSGVPSVETTARLIFPRSYWNPGKPRVEFYARFQKNFPRIKRASRKNNYGTYFHRLISYPGAPCGGNQLEFIIDLYANKKVSRETALQAAVFYPNKDLTAQRQRGFPCLQQVMFSVTDQQRLAVTGVYARQYIDDRGYGNYLGLCWLGRFMAHEMGLALEKVCCIATSGGLGGTKARGRKLVTRCRALSPG
jgi:hypothetical protein